MKLPLQLLALAGFFVTTAAHASPPMPPALADLAARVMPSVVSVASTDPVTDNATDNAQNNDQDQDNNQDSSPDQQDKATGGLKPSGVADTTSGSVLPPPKAQEALGSGFVIDPAGFIVTNNHVIDGATSVTVTFQDGTILPATIIGRDTQADLAVLKVDAGHPLSAVTFGDSSTLRVGDWVLAIGNPFGLSGSTSAGIVSALHRDINENKYDDFIQTDATINRGNSGGPLFDLSGHVIGVNAAIYSPSGGSIGIGFAIPAAMAQPITAALEATGQVQRGWLGISTEAVTPAIQTLMNLPDSNGALIGSIAAASPASGILQPGDVLVSLNGVTITDPRSLMIRTAQIPAGQTAKAVFWRNGRKQSGTISITVPAPDEPPGSVTQTSPTANITLPAIGMAIAANTTAADGAHILSVTTGGPAAKAGIVAADIVNAVDTQTINTASDLQDALKQRTASHTQLITLLVSGDDATGADPGPRWLGVVVK